MDLNQLYFDHQLSAVRATRLPTAVLRHEAKQVSSAIAAQIECIQRASGALAAPGWGRLADEDDGRFNRKPTTAVSIPSQAAGSPRQSPLREDSENPDRGRADGSRLTAAFLCGVSVQGLLARRGTPH